MLTHTLFSNSPNRSGDFTINFFYENARSAGTAQLACPFFSTIEPLKILKDAGCGRIRLVVRLCNFTRPRSLREARELGDVQIRYYTSDAFHAKFYILGNVALVGSANLTGAAMKSNRELSIAVHQSEEWFDEIPSLFDELWNAASVLSDDVLGRFTNWHRTVAPPIESDRIEGFDAVSPPTVNVASGKISPERTYLETYRREYYENLIPCYRIIQSIYEELGRRHPDFQSYQIRYEIDRFLSWTKLTFTTDDTLESNPIRGADDIATNIRLHLNKWLGASQLIDERRVARIAHLNEIFGADTNLEAISFPELTDALLGCAAFNEQLRFTKGAEEALVKAFQEDNSLLRVRSTFLYLSFGSGEFVQRTYDCIYDPERKLRHFGRSCVMELFGWVNRENVPPLNMRAVKAMRYLGFNVRV